MTRDAADLDYARLFAAAPDACVVLDTELRIVGANDAYSQVTGRPMAQLLGRGFFEAYPQDPDDQAAESARRQRASLEAALDGRRDTLFMHRFAIAPADRAGGAPEARWWNVVNVPVFGADGRVEAVIHRVEDITDLVDGVPATETLALEPQARLFTRAQELQQAILELRERAARTHDLALTLQSAMLVTPDLARHPEIAVRYQPADRELNACGDWYDVVDLAEDKVALSVGDVVGHGVQAASVMGMLRGAYSAAVRIADGPSGTLEALGLYARAHEAAMASTTFACQLFQRSRLLTYSNAGHPPPLLLCHGGGHRFLDQATDPPLGVRWEHVPRPQATLDYADGDTLVLYTDGLIERRGESLDAGLDRLLAGALARQELPPDELADELLRLLANPAGTQDDVCLLVARL